MAFSRSIFIYLILFALAPEVAKFYGNADLTSLLESRPSVWCWKEPSAQKPTWRPRTCDFRGGSSQSRWRHHRSSHHGRAWISLSGRLGLSDRYLRRKRRPLCSVLRDLSFPSVHQSGSRSFQGVSSIFKGVVRSCSVSDHLHASGHFCPGKTHSYLRARYYSLGISVAQVPAGFITNLLAQIFMPALSHVQDDKARIRRIVLQVTGFMMCVAMPAVVFAYFCGGPLLTLIYGHQYAVAAIPLALASCCALVAFVNNQITTAFYAAGAPQLHRLCVVMMAVVMMVLTYPLAKWLGPAGGQLASLVAIAVGFLIQLNRARHLIGIRVSQYGKLFLQGWHVGRGPSHVCWHRRLLC